eukprot:1159575-Pelagomonas_calceolata.AAC.4
MYHLQSSLPSSSVLLPKPRPISHAHICRKALMKTRRRCRSSATSENGPQLQEDILHKSLNESLTSTGSGEDLQGSQQGNRTRPLPGNPGGAI